MDLGGISNVIIGWLGSTLTWLIVVVVVVLFGFGGLYLRKRKKLEYPVYIVANLGNGKTSIRETKAGWFKNRWVLFGLWDIGNETELKLADGRKVLAGSLEDMQEINGQMGFIVYRKEDDPKIVVPVSKVDVYNKKLIMGIAPAEYRDAASNIIEGAVKETQTTWEKLTPVVMYGVIVVFSLIVILFVIQFANKQVDKAGEILNAVAQAINVQPSQIYNTTAP